MFIFAFRIQFPIGISFTVSFVYLFLGFCSVEVGLYTRGFSTWIDDANDSSPAIQFSCAKKQGKEDGPFVARPACLRRLYST